jgi:hypothetical protein
MGMGSLPVLQFHQTWQYEGEVLMDLRAQDYRGSSSRRLNRGRPAHPNDDNTCCQTPQKWSSFHG